MGVSPYSDTSAMGGVMDKEAKALTVWCRADGPRHGRHDGHRRADTRHHVAVGVLQGRLNAHGHGSSLILERVQQEVAGPASVRLRSGRHVR